ncbi:MAG TPA: trimeric intracellular cation channel family protein [Stellaceae bacterium]|jgi:uncharacterized membrane protein YeiH|nr:trimeric intracellular cation channel family protein [Stellaceae bacterium]
MTHKAAIGSHIIRLTDLAGTFVFAVEGSLAAMAAGLDPIGVLVLAFLTALGGGITRDLMLGATPVAAVADRYYALIVLGAAILTWLARPLVQSVPFWAMTSLDAAGLALFAIAGTQKALDRAMHPVVAILLGTVGAVGGGALRDIVLNQVPNVLRADIYATAAMAGALVVVLGRALSLRPQPTAVAGALTCFCLRLAAVALHWQLPLRPY